MAGPPRRRLVRAGTAVVVRLRVLVALVWAGAAVAAVTWLPTVTEEGGDRLAGFVAPDSRAVATERASFARFGLPLLSRTAVVQRDPDGLPPRVQARAGLAAARVTRGDHPELRPLRGALPVPNTLGLVPGSRERGTTVLTYLFHDPRSGFAARQEAAHAYADRFLGAPEDGLVGVTGSVPARVEQVRLIRDRLPLVEAVTLSAVAVLVALTFRSLVAPLVTLAAAGVAVVVVVRGAPVVGDALGVPVPSELEPLVVALLLGIVTDYTVFYVAALRERLRAGDAAVTAARRAAVATTPIVATAGITVAAGTAALLVARSSLFRGFGPGMALAVLVGLVVAVTLVPALLALAGRATFWPGRPERHAGPEPRPGLVTRLVTRRASATVLVLCCVGGLAYAATPLADARLGLGFVPSLPAGNEVRRAAAAAEAGFSPGILAPTELLLTGDRVADRRAALRDLGERLERRPGVDGVVGPGRDLPPDALGVLLAREGDAARFLLVLGASPLGAQAVDDLAALRQDMPALLADSGLAGTSWGLAGDSAIAEEVVADTTRDLGRIAVAALAVNLLVLVLFLRALVAPLYLLACSVLALLATLGLTTWLFTDVLGHDGLTFYVPFAAAVLLVALGSDYNVFGVGSLWEEARRRPLREAVRVALPRSTRAITAAGAVLAVSFGLLALVPLRPFRELAFAMAVGIVLDVLVVRSVLAPALLTLVGRASAWPSRRLAPDPGQPPTGSPPRPPDPPTPAASPEPPAAPGPASSSDSSESSESPSS